MGSESAFVSRASERLARPAQLAAVGVNFTCRTSTVAESSDLCVLFDVQYT